MRAEPPPSALAAVVTANTGFYRAFQDLDLDAMSNVWAHTASVCCIHPGWAPLVGWSDVKSSFVAIFSTQGWLRVAPTDVDVTVSGSMAWVRCVEVVSSLSGRGPSQAHVAATNLFQEEEGRWRMILHHGSPMLGDRSE